MNKVRLFGTILKVNEDDQTVQGYASTEAIDSHGEIVTKDAMRGAVERYMSLPGGGNLREMHQPSAVGKVPIMKEDDKGFFVEAKVVDDGAWKKVKESVYTGFSIGGRINKQVGNKIKDLSLSEISLVDRPANPEAMFSLVKIDDLNKGLYTAEALLLMALDIKYLAESYKANGKNTKKLDKILKLLSDSVVGELQEGELELLNDASDFIKEHQDEISLAIKESYMAEKKGEKKDEAKKDESKVIVDEVEQGIQKMIDENEVDKLTKIYELVSAVLKKDEEVEEAEEEKEEEEAEEAEEEAEEKDDEVEEAEKLEKVDLAKVEDRFLAKVEEALKPLNDRIDSIEKTAMPLKTRAPFAVKREGESEDDAEMIALRKRYDELEEIKKNDLPRFQKEFQQEANQLVDKLFS